MKKVVLASAFALTAVSASAGSYSEPMIEAPVIVEEAAGSSLGGSAALILLGVLAIAAVVSAD
ncbi:hypothetical protein [Celeribacter marinus]|uniref:Uncharacterized protein n=1 Tax=Celeribacter marinus TaxID=1397108 RepID=A0A0N9ZF66_9RHOB|nr:hypothetical protein [Celeribacter marinus]ALI55574.1 hypothetical protein IMCC12053_1627 [Celeribacter marinus]SFK22834.1 hypothetical protein SAMN05444421_102179 [Celeribacter marinus]